MSDQDPLLDLLSRFQEEGVEYVLVGGQAVRLNGYLRATEDIDVLVKASRENGERIIRALRAAGRLAVHSQRSDLRIGPAVGAAA